MSLQISSTKDMDDFGIKLGAILVDGIVIELIGDVGAGKTTLAKGIAMGMGVEDNVQSPSFTISQVYEGHDNLRLAHYDFYRLKDAGIMKDELSEVVNDPKTVTLIEWSEIVQGVLPEDRLTISITPLAETTRELSIQSSGPMSRWVEEQL
jgi:tRNA threonylcarbamoyladenosine biosynthesis protein TsaE